MLNQIVLNFVKKKLSVLVHVLSSVGRLLSALGPDVQETVSSNQELSADSPFKSVNDT